MKRFETVRSRVVVLPVADIDTDRIIPARFLKVTSKEGLAAKLFNDWPDFPREAARGAEVLCAGPNFGCGSSREHAVWALMDFGFKVVIAPSFADIFRSNALKCGLLPVALDLVPPGEVVVDLEAQVVETGGQRYPFTVEPFARKLMLAGQDELGWLVSFVPRIEAFECRR
jgi:3-isopropylmalate/(R)-2-methylmalate dehydratase small subunit